MELEVIGIEQIREEVLRICSKLDINPPDEVRFLSTREKLFSLSLLPIFAKVTDGGTRLGVVKSRYLETYRDRIGRAYWSVLVRRSPNWITRHLLVLDILFVSFFIPDFLISSALLGYLIPLGLVSVALIQVGYILVAYKLSRLHVERGEIIADAMLKIGSWSEERAIKYKKEFPAAFFILFLFLPIITIIILFAYLFYGLINV